MSEFLKRCEVSLVDLLDGARIFGAPNIVARRCTSDWRRVRPGDLFAALVGDQSDGHDNAHQAVAQGAAAIVCERPLPVFGIPQCLVDDSRQAYGEICHALAGSPSSKLRVIGVTGSAGKTCVSTLLASVLETAGGQVGRLDGLAADDGSESSLALDHTPEPDALAHWLSRMVDSGTSHAVVELASDALAQSRLAGLELDAACITNIDRDHLGRHGSEENYRRATARIFEQLRPHGVAVINADDPRCCRLLSELHHPTLTFGVQKPAEVTAHVVERFVGEQTFLIQAGSESAAVRSRIAGEHHMTNCLAAATLGLAYGIDLATIARGLEAVERIPGRMDRVEFGQQFGLWLDAADSPQRLRNSLEAVRQVARGRVICCLAPRSDSSRSMRRQLQQVVRRLADIAIVVESNRGRQEQQVHHGSAAIAWAVRRAEPGDTVLLAVSPHAAWGRLELTQPGPLRQWLRQLATARADARSAA